MFKHYFSSFIHDVLALTNGYFKLFCKWFKKNAVY